jgi:hypothetical protein
MSSHSLTLKVSNAQQARGAEKALAFAAQTVAQIADDPANLDAIRERPEDFLRLVSDTLGKAAAHYALDLRTADFVPAEWVKS